MAGVKLLAVETSSPIFSVAVCDGPEILTFRLVDGQGPASSMLTDLIEGGLQKAGLKMEELDGFAISIGPGSFTGLRIGVMTVKALAWALKKPVLPVSSLEVIAHNAADGSKDVWVLLDACKGNVYSAVFSPAGGGALRRTGPDELLSPDEALKKVQGPVRVIGAGIKKYGHKLAELGAGWAETVPPEQWIPRADVVARIAAAAWPQGRVDDAHTLVPQYLYSQESNVIEK